MSRGNVNVKAKCTKLRTQFANMWSDNIYSGESVVVVVVGEILPFKVALKILLLNMYAPLNLLRL